MKLEEFNAKVAELKAEGAKLAQAGKLEEAEAIVKELTDRYPIYPEI